MFDSENIPLVTRVEAGPGIIVSYVQTVDQEGVWTATLDSDYVTTIFAKKFSDSDLETAVLVTRDADSRLKVLEDLLGATYVPSGTSTSTTIEDSDTFRDIRYTQTPGNLTSQMKIRWNILSVDGSAIVSRDVVFAAGSTKLNVLNAMMYSIKSNASAMSYLTTIRFDDGDKIHFNWKPSYSGFKISVEVLQTTDNVTFTINQ